MHLYVGKEGQGLKAREYHTRRNSTVKTVFKASMVSAAHLHATSAVDAQYMSIKVQHCEVAPQRTRPCLQRVGAVMVTGPPRSGKTSLLKLLYEAARRSTLFSDIFYVNLADKLGISNRACTLWHDLERPLCCRFPRYVYTCQCWFPFAAFGVDVLLMCC